jgi:predicted aspartyl protease
METLEFSEVYKYDTRLVGITVPVALFTGAENSAFKAKIDTGSSFCIFERKNGERLGIEVESGEEIRISTATDSFTAYGHELTMVVLGIETYAKVYFAKEDWFTRNVLGRQGFLDRVKLGLIDYEGKLLLSDYGK